MCLSFPMMKVDKRSLDSPIDRTSTRTPQVSRSRRLPSSETVITTPAAYIVAKGMREAVYQKKERRQKRDDDFDAFGKYIAKEFRYLYDTNSAQRVQFKVARESLDLLPMSQKLF